MAYIRALKIAKTHLANLDIHFESVGPGTVKLGNKRIHAVKVLLTGEYNRLLARPNIMAAITDALKEKKSSAKIFHIPVVKNKTLRIALFVYCSKRQTIPTKLMKRIQDEFK
jgi:hypothetical protein